TIIKWLTAPVAAPPGTSRADESGDERKERADDQGRIPIVEEAPVESPDGKEAPEESPDGDAAPAIFDHEGLLYRLMDDEALAREVVEEFLTFTSDYVKVLEEALEKRDAPVLRREAHTLKGAAGNVGADVLQELAHQVQAAAEDENFHEATSLIPEVKEQFDAFKKELEISGWK
ncbi:MAG: Hpt domain-containing protein, partial [Desulfobacterales bacterium]|nr:Hpt domain-containing protein [Desulfobacterales bacterium]